MMKEGSIASGISTEFDIGRNITRSMTRVRFRSCGTVGYGPTLNQGGGIQCGHYAGFVRKQLVNDVGNNIGTRSSGQGEPFSCTLIRGGPIGKVLVHRWLLKCHRQ